MGFKDLLLKFITLLHTLFVLFVVVTPFIDSNYFLFLHLMIVPFVMFHWVLNDNTCVLTIIERKLRKDLNSNNSEDETDDNSIDEDCITCKLIEPVYDFRKNYDTFSNIIYGITTILWLITVAKLGLKYYHGDLTSLRQVFML